jgi:hypothetical protein
LKYRAIISLAETRLLPVGVERLGRQSIRLGHSGLGVRGEHAWNVSGLCVDLILVAVSRIGNVHVWINNFVDFLPLLIDKLVRGSQVPLIKVVTGWSVSEKQVGLEANTVVRVERGVYFLLVHLFHDRLLIARFKFKS